MSKQTSHKEMKANIEAITRECNQYLDQIKTLKQSGDQAYTQGYQDGLAGAEQLSHLCNYYIRMLRGSKGSKP